MHYLQSFQETEANTSSGLHNEQVRNFSFKTQSQTTYATLVRDGDNHTVTVVKQKIWVNGTSYELQDIYGIEASLHETDENQAEDDAMSKECVICLAAPRDTTVLPCRHMCMCASCAMVLRYRTTACPICRCTIDSLLQIKVRTPSAAPVFFVRNIILHRSDSTLCVSGNRWHQGNPQKHHLQRAKMQLPLLRYQIDSRMY